MQVKLLDIRAGNQLEQFEGCQDDVVVLGFGQPLFGVDHLFEQKENRGPHGLEQGIEGLFLESQDEDPDAEENQNHQVRVHVFLAEHRFDFFQKDLELVLFDVLFDVPRVDDEANALEALDPQLIFGVPRAEERTEVDSFYSTFRSSSKSCSFGSRR